MSQIVGYPQLVLALGLVTLWLSAQIGVSFRKRRRIPEEGSRRFRRGRVRFPNTARSYRRIQFFDGQQPV